MGASIDTFIKLKDDSNNEDKIPAKQKDQQVEKENKPNNSQGILIDCSISALKKKVNSFKEAYGLLPETALKSVIKVILCKSNNNYRGLNCQGKLYNQ